VLDFPNGSHSSVVVKSISFIASPPSRDGVTC